MPNDIDITAPQIAAEGAAVPVHLVMPERMALSFEQIYAEHAARVLSLLLRLGVPSSDVNDVAQDVFMVVHAKLPSFEWRCKPSTWIHAICARKASEYRRKARRRHESLAAEPADRAHADQPERNAHDQQQLALLRQALSSLPEKQMQVFVLFEIEELSMAEVAAIVGCPLFTAYARHKTARARVEAFFRKRRQR